MENKLYTVTEEDLVSIINVVAYEDYAKVYRKLHRVGFNRRPTYEEFIRNCPVFEMLPSMPDDVWHHGYEYIADLFDDNEKNGTPCDEEACFNQSVSELLSMFYKRRQ